MKRIISILLFLIIFSACKTSITRTELPIIDNSKNLYSFIGKKVSVIEFDPNEHNTIVTIDSITGDTIIEKKGYVMDNGFLCKYVVVRNLFNKLEKDTVEFKAYDHYGRPGFEASNEVVLYLSKSDNGQYFHRKYQFENLFIDSNKKIYSHPKFLGKGYLESANELKSFNTEFPKDHKFNIKGLSKDGIKMYYPESYYKIEDEYAYPIRGMFIEELIKFRLNTTFKDL